MKWVSDTGEEKLFSLFPYYHLSLKKNGALHLNKLVSTLPKDVFAKFGWNWSYVSGEDFYILSMYSRYLVRLLTSLENGMTPHLKRLKIPLTRNALCHVWLKWPCGSAEDFWKMLSMYFRYFFIISPLKRAWPFIWTNVNPLYPSMLCAKFGWNWPYGSREDLFKYCECIFSISLLSPHGKRRDPSFEQINPLYPRMLCAKFGWNWLCDSENRGKWKYDKITTTTTTDNGQT